MKKAIVFCLFAVLLISFPLSAGATSFTYSATDLPQAISDYHWTSSITVAEDIGLVTDINVMVYLTHTYVADLNIYLSHEDSDQAVSIELFNQHGGGGNNLYYTNFDDEASTWIGSASAPFNGTYQPYQLNLSAFDGMDLQGTWILRVYDDCYWDSGTLREFSISGTYDPVPEPATMLLLGAGLIGAAGARARRKMMR